jgi:hypothetical protein
MDFEKFERLEGIELGRFVADAAKRERLDQGIMNYYRSRRAILDGPHLEMIISLLGRLGTTEAMDEVTKHLDHPVKYVKNEALQVVSQASSLDEKAIANVVNALKLARFPEDRELLEHALSKAGTEAAKTLSERFRRGQ